MDSQEWAKLMADTDQWLASMRTIIPILGEYTTMLNVAGLPPVVCDALILGVAREWGLPVGANRTQP